MYNVFSWIKEPMRLFTLVCELSSFLQCWHPVPFQNASIQKGSLVWDLKLLSFFHCRLNVFKRCRSRWSVCLFVSFFLFLVCFGALLPTKEPFCYLTVNATSTWHDVASNRPKRPPEAWKSPKTQQTPSKHTTGKVFRLKDVRAKNFYNTDFFHTLATVR